jgi:hypothetical protein
MVAVDECTAFGLVVEVGPKVDSADYVPASAKLLLKPFFDILCCIFEVGNLAFDHLEVYVLSEQESVLPHFDGHITKFGIG